MNYKVIRVGPEEIEFEKGIKLSSNHNQDCCESHYLCFEHLTIEDFDGLEFNLEEDNFFNRLEWYGIELIPVKGHSVRIPGYGSNNGYYSTDLSLVLSGLGNTRLFDISECQDISE